MTCKDTRTPFNLHNLRYTANTASIIADDFLEFHAARLLLLFHICGTKGKLEGLTKMAKLDFFVRYPEFFSVVCEKLGVKVRSPKEAIESKMVRFHYGPWDHRYYDVLGFLKALGLINYYKEGNKIVFSITPKGSNHAAELVNLGAYIDLVAQINVVYKILGKKKGTELKELIYKVFDEEVAKRELGEVID